MKRISAKISKKFETNFFVPSRETTAMSEHAVVPTFRMHVSQSVIARNWALDATPSDDATIALRCEIPRLCAECGCRGCVYTFAYVERMRQAFHKASSPMYFPATTIPRCLKPGNNCNALAASS